MGIGILYDMIYHTNDGFGFVCLKVRRETLVDASRDE